MFIVEQHGGNYKWHIVYQGENPIEALEVYNREYEALRQGGVRMWETRQGKPELIIKDAWSPNPRMRGIVGPALEASPGGKE